MFRVFEERENVEEGRDSAGKRERVDVELNRFINEETFNPVGLDKKGFLTEARRTNTRGNHGIAFK
jgi:hypothetical protein